MIKVHILDKCPHCHGQAMLPVGEGKDYKGRTYTRYAPCPDCEGSGNSRAGSACRTLLSCCARRSASTSTLPHRAACISALGKPGMTSSRSARTAAHTLNKYLYPYLSIERLPVAGRRSFFVSRKETRNDRQ